MLKEGGKQKPYQMWQAGISLAASPLEIYSRASPAMQYKAAPPPLARSRIPPATQAMSGYTIPPPPPMNVKDDVPTNWKMFRQAWEYWVTATELKRKSKDVQAGALCSVMGLECVKVMNSLTTLAPEDKSDPEKILTVLGNHFMPQKHLLF